MPREQQHGEPRPAARPRYRLRTSWMTPLLIAALALLGVALIGKVGSWNAVLDVLRVQDRERFTNLALLAAGLLGLLMLARLLVSYRR